MNYNLDVISKMSLELDEYEIYLQDGHGVQESPYVKKKTMRTLIGSEVEAWAHCCDKNRELHGPMSERNSWEVPVYRYRVVKDSEQ